MIALALAAVLQVMATDSGRFVTPDSARLYYEECGRASGRPTVVPLHDGLPHCGISCNSKSPHTSLGVTRSRAAASG